jgi:hypothetical protein
MRDPNELTRREILKRLSVGVVGLGALAATGCVGHYRREDRRDDRQDERQDERKEDRQD